MNVTVSVTLELGLEGSGNIKLQIAVGLFEEWHEKGL